MLRNDSRSFRDSIVFALSPLSSYVMFSFNTIMIFKLLGHDTYLEDSVCAKVLSRLFGGVRFRENETRKEKCTLVFFTKLF